MKIKSHFLLLIMLLVTLISSCAPMDSFDEESFSKPIDTSNAGDKIKTGHLNQGEPLKEPRNQSQFQAGQYQPPQIPEPQPSEPLLLNYHLGKGDLISIKVFGEEDFSKTTHLSESGTISYPFLGELQLSGFTIKEIEQTITDGLQGDYLVNPKVTVTVLEYRQLFVNGEVKNPGGYAFVPGMTVNKAISLAGGFTDIASREEIFIIREGNTEAAPSLVNLKSYVGPGDIITVKEYKKFFVNGEVKKPGGYDFIPDLTVEKAISMAGGFDKFASANWGKIYLIRDGGKKTRVKLNTPVEPGDIITVEESTF
ncbi:MAG: hypothetical protein DRR19_22565 [Candidatus Parabeggiatoa sp. nov. 1]|nr:MAG: hypothetical protein DRR19_22565 [Gammaproteobacteria bacterium]